MQSVSYHRVFQSSYEQIDLYQMLDKIKINVYL